MCSVGLPLISLILTASPSLNPSTPSCEIGFCSKNSLTNSCAYRIVRRYRVGRRSFSIMDCDKSKTKIKCRIISRCNGVVSLRSLQKYFELSTTARIYGHSKGFYPALNKEAYLFLLPASKSPSTVELIVPSAPSTNVSQVLETSHSAPPRCFLRFARGAGASLDPCKATSSSSSVAFPIYSSSESAMFSRLFWIASGWEGEERYINRYDR